jgi:hypothetical protein
MRLLRFLSKFKAINYSIHNVGQIYAFFCAVCVFKCGGLLVNTYSVF